LNSYEYGCIVTKLARRKKEGLVNMIKFKNKWDKRYFLGNEVKKSRQCDNMDCLNEIPPTRLLIFTDAVGLDFTKLVGKEKRLVFCPSRTCISGRLELGVLRNPFTGVISHLGRIDPKKKVYVGAHSDLDKMMSEGITFV
jgi:hypothetical protein